MSLFAVVLAGGKGKRLKSDIPKPYCRVNGLSLMEYSLLELLKVKKIKKIIIVYNRKHKKFLNSLRINKKIVKISGGKNRQESCFNALKYSKNKKCKKILIHDAARPNLNRDLIEKIIKKLKTNNVVVPITKSEDSMKYFLNGKIKGNANRRQIVGVQTPQGYDFSKLIKKHTKYRNKNFNDDSGLFIIDKEKVATVSGIKNNYKITSDYDFIRFKKEKGKSSYFGIGYDIHKLKKGKYIFLGGIKIPFSKALVGHSDGDPVLHALIDSLLGACGLGDIGLHFSNKNEKFKNISSTKLLSKIIKIMEQKKIIINNIDINIITEKPKISKYKNKMISIIASLCKIDKNQINIKGKTTEKLGIIGKEEAIASEVVSSIIKND